MHNVCPVEMSGLIFVALALVWAVALLPKALRHHDELAQTRPVDQVSDSARVLARREVVSEKQARLVVPTPTPRPAASSDPAPVQQTRTPVGPDRVRTRIAAQRKAAAAAARRRRRILSVLLVVVVGAGAAVAIGQLPVWSVGLPVVLTLSFLALARVTVRREHARWDAELVTLKVSASTSPTTAAAPAAPAAPAAEDDATAPAAPAVVVQEHNEQGLAVVSGLDDTSSFPMGLLDDVVPTTDSGSLWDPLPVTLPTYVSKPRANRSVRTIDLSAPGVSSSGHDAASSALVADAATSAPPDEPRRAVGS